MRVVPVDKRLLDFDDGDLGDPVVPERRDEREADAEPTDQDIVWCLMALQRGVYEQLLGMSATRVHQERAVADDLVVVVDLTKHELTTLGRDSRDDDRRVGHARWGSAADQVDDHADQDHGQGQRRPDEQHGGMQGE